ncbi:MAG: hypothetical protein CMN28_08805 [Salinisphaeraceae bacterium]|nr:hypothetical protein [Salinisphaeraceae bacterium]
MSDTDNPTHLDISAPEEPPAGTPISYQTFGENFIRYLVTVPRLRDELEGAVQDTVEGSVEALPNEMLVASYRFAPRKMDIERQVSDTAEVAFALLVDGRLTLKVKAMGIGVGLPLEVKIKVDIDVRTLAPLTIQLEPRPLTHRNVRVTTEMPKELRMLPTHLLDRLNPLAIAVADNIVRETNRRLKHPELKKAAHIDVLTLAENAMSAAG